MALASLCLSQPAPTPPSSSPRNRSKAKILTSISTVFPRIPSWVSLNRPASAHSPQLEAPRGLVENIHLVSLARQGRFEEALEFLRSMEACGISIRTHFFEQLFDACGTWRSLSGGKFFHEKIKNVLGRDPDGLLGNCLLKMYHDCSSFRDAWNVFDGMAVKSVGAWRTMVYGYAKGGLVTQAVGVLLEMCLAGYDPDPMLLVTLITGVLEHSSISMGREVHSFAIRIGMVDEVSVDTALVNMYVKLGSLESAVRVFERMERTNAVTWTGLMVGYMEEETEEDVLNLFREMVHKDVAMDLFVFSIVLKACSRLVDLESGRIIHGLIVKLGMDVDVSVGTPLVDFYFKCGCVRDARCAFEKITLPNEYSWSALISGYYQTGEFEMSIRSFKYLRGRDMNMNALMYTSVLQACAALADSSSGRQLHAEGIKKGLISELYGETALVTMYSRSGDLHYARQAFSLIEKPDTVAWTATICGCAYHGHASEALDLFSRMQRSGVSPNAVTFVGILTACSHSGLVLEARKCLDSMERVYGVRPTTDHFNCLVDIYCRAHRLEEAFSLTEEGAFEPDAMTWKILLSGSTSHLNVELGKIAGKRLLTMEPNDAAGYILLFNLYASLERWDDAAAIRRSMNERGILKEVGCSWMTVKGQVHRFIVGDRHHQRMAEIYGKLEELGPAMSFEHPSAMGAVPYGLLSERKHQLLDHSEKLAVAFGLISTPSGSPITIFKNLRICQDCHSFCKLVSKTKAREIVIRDSSRFHHFNDGLCSCNDYW